MSRSLRQTASRAAALLLVLGSWAAPAAAQKLTLQLESREAYAEIPFVLSISAEGFEEDPAPEAPTLAIEGCRVTFIGTSPNVSSGVRIVNGQMSEWRKVTFVFRYRVEAPTAGRYTVPPLTVSQGNRSASTSAGTFIVKQVSATNDMRLELVLPKRPVWVGETFDVYLDWMLKRDVGDHSFAVPLFDLDQVEIQPGEPTGRALAFTAGALNVELPYTQQRVTVGGEAYTRLRFHGRVTVNRPGNIELEPAKVAANLQEGTARDSFGFRVPRYALYKAQDQPRRLNVRPLPLEGRPGSFENAIGSAFSMAVQASRTVVQVGDPIQLEIRIRGDGPLEGLSLPDLSGDEGLPEDRFSVADETAVGVIDPEGGGKTFDVTVRINSAAATEIPPLAFSYFDPVDGAYRTIHSDPIALSVAGSAVVGAADVASAGTATVLGDVGTASGAAGGSRPTSTLGELTTLIGADLSLSAPDLSLRGAWSPGDVAPWVILLYLLPLGVVGVRMWQVRTQGSRGRSRELKQAVGDVERALDSGRPAREAAPEVLAAVRALAKMTGREKELAAGPLERLETSAFDPSAGAQPLVSEQIEAVRKLARGWAASGGESGSVSTVLVAGLLLTAGAALPAVLAADDDPEKLARAREVYQAALEEPDRVLRTNRFAEAERLFAELAAEHPASPDLLTDLGNAALGAQEIGSAVLAYRRALSLDPKHERARKNLAWLRARNPEWLPRPQESGVLDSLFFWHHRLSVSQRYLIGALAFAGGLLLMIPWSAARAKTMRRLAMPLLVIWLALTVSALLTPDPAKDAVVMTDGTPLRSADSLGAPASLANPLPAGTEVRILEERSRWTRVALADGTRGWVGASSVESVAR